jgi:hypothetical protein
MLYHTTIHILAQVIEYMLQCNEASDEGIALEVGHTRALHQILRAFH